MEGMKGEEKSHPKAKDKGKANASPSSPKRKGSHFKICICRYCGRRFLNAQALGGHQNAHKMERNEAKNHRKEISSMIMMSLMPSSVVHNGHDVSKSFHPAAAVFNNYYWPGSYFIDDHMHRGAPSSSSHHHVPATTTTPTHAHLQRSDESHHHQYPKQLTLPDLNLDPPLSSP